MTVPTTDYYNSFEGDDLSTEFSYTFRVTSESHVKVYLDDVLQSSGYSVKMDTSGVGGTVTFTSAPGDGVAILLQRESDLLQEDHLEANETLPPSTIERMVDKIAIIGQQLARQILSCVRLADTVDPATIDTELPEPAALEILRWNEDADALENVSAAQAFNDAVPDGFSGNVVGPAISTSGAVALWNATNGSLLKDGPAAVTEGDVLTVESGAWVAKAPAATPPAEAYVVPSGTVGLFFDASHIPDHWTVCDGSTVTINSASFVTPDCRGHYLLGAASDDSGSTGHTGATVRPGIEGGALTHAHLQQGTFATSQVDPGSSPIYPVSGAGSYVKTGSLGHGHSVGINGYTATNSNRPISIALIVAIKVDE